MRHFDIYPTCTYFYEEPNNTIFRRSTGNHANGDPEYHYSQIGAFGVDTSNIRSTIDFRAITPVLYTVRQEQREPIMISIDITDARNTPSTGTCVGDYYVMCQFNQYATYKNPKITNNKVYPVWFKKFDSLGVDSSILLNALNNTGMNKKIFHIVFYTSDGLRNTEAYTTPVLYNTIIL